jgi:glycerophosphoryl diester phosphodiesterase
MEHPSSFPKIISHQGYGKQFSEFMLHSLKTAAAAKVDMIEIDVHETRDGRFIVHHDDAICRDSPVWGLMTYSRLQQFENHHERAPLLSDCLEVIGSTPVDIEIKSYLDFDRLAQALDTALLAPGSVISSVDLEVLQALHQRGIELPLLLIVAISHRRSARQNIVNARLCLSPHRLPEFLTGVAIHHYLARKRLVRALRRDNKKIFVWTVDEWHEMRKFIALGVDGIITNYPKRLLLAFTMNPSGRSD